MGKASKWFRGLLGLKKTDCSTSSYPSQSSATSKPTPKKKWSFVKSYREKDHQQNFHNKPIQRSSAGLGQSVDNDDQSKHAIAVAEATKAVAEAAVAAAEAAAAVVRLTSSGRAITTDATTTTTTMTSTSSFANGAAVALNSTSGYLGEPCAGYGDREEWAAVKIQAYFRAYLSRRALRALKAVVRLQALVRGHVVRKRNADELRRMQALVRVQARACTGRLQNFESPLKYQFNYPGPATPEKFEHIIRARSLKHAENLMFRRNGLKSNGKVNSNQEKARIGSNWLDCEVDVRSWEQEGSSMKTNSRDDDRDKILEVDNGKPYAMPRRRNLFHSCHLSLGSDHCSHSFTTSKESTAHQTALSPSSCEVQSFSPMKFSQDDEEPYCTAHNSPQFYSTSSKCGATNRGPFTPTKSDCSRSCLSVYSDHPNYMAYTESSKAKVRSLSAPKQRPQYERSSSTKRYSIHGFGDSRMTTQKVSSLHSNFTSKAYPGSGRLDRLGMPVREDLSNFSGGHWHRY